MSDVTYELLLKPISKKLPCGDDIRHGDEYDLIQEARREDDPNLPQGVWKTELKRADWTKIIHTCNEILAEKSKDLQVVAWLMEAHIKKEGLRGLSEGIKLFGMLSDIFWDDLFPQIVDGDIEARLTILDWINEKIPERVYELAVAEKLEESDNFTFGEWVIVSGNQKVEVNRTRLGRLRTAIARTNPAVYQSLEKDIHTAQKALSQLDDLMGKKHKRTQGSLYKLKRVLEDFRSFVEEVLRDICPAPQKEAPKENPANSPERQTDTVVSEGHDHAAPVKEYAAKESGVDMSPPASGVGEIRNRHDAYEQLSHVIAYLSAHEPHNPGHFLLRKVMSWSDLELGDIMKEIMQYPQFYQNTFEQFGGKRGTVPASQSSQAEPARAHPEAETQSLPQGGEFYPIQPKGSQAHYQQQYDALRQFGDDRVPLDTPASSSKQNR